MLAHMFIRIEMTAKSQNNKNRNQEITGWKQILGPNDPQPKFQREFKFKFKL